MLASGKILLTTIASNEYIRVHFDGDARTTMSDRADGMTDAGNHGGGTRADREGAF